MHDHDDTNDLDFAMLTPPTRPGPCKAATALEVDPVERRREQALARMIAKHEASALRNMVANVQHGIEVRHGSGKVKV